jgi:hypothetical protein
VTVLKRAYYAGGALWAGVSKHLSPGQNIYDSDWDICIVLDSARCDLVAETLPASLSVRAHDESWSVGSVTTEWLTNTFTRQHTSEIAETTLVSATPHTTTVFEDRAWLTSPEDAPCRYPSSPAVGRDAFENLYELWRHQTGEAGVVPPDVMADATIGAYQKHGSRVVSHWLQPHEPFIAPDAPLVGGKALETNVWEGLQRGDLDADAVWDSYRANLEWTWQFVERVCEAVDATVLVTADHGNAFGEWGIYGHPFGWPQPQVRKVPFLFVEAARERSVSPAVDLTPTATPDRDAQLRALGYR